MKKTILTLTIAAGLLSFVGSAKADLINLVANGNPANNQGLTDWSYGSYQDPAVDPVVSGYLSVHDYVYNSPYTTKYVFGGEPGGGKVFSFTDYSYMYQSIPTLAGNKYLLSFYYQVVNNTPWGSAAANYNEWLQVSVGDNILFQSLNEDSTLGTPAGEPTVSGDVTTFSNATYSILPYFSQEFTAAANDEVLNIEGFNLIGRNAITDILIVDITAPDPAAVPEPSQVAASLLLLAGIAGFAIVKRRKNASALVA